MKNQRVKSERESANRNRVTIGRRSVNVGPELGQSVYESLRRRVVLSRHSSRFLSGCRSLITDQHCCRLNASLASSTW
ncbi:hypothetical protein U1Q18_029293 [Sarracenia purpurea var. burkii]